MDWDLIVVVAIIVLAILLALALKAVTLVFAKKGIGTLAKKVTNHKNRD